MTALTRGDWLDELLTPQTEAGSEANRRMSRREPILLSESLKSVALNLLYDLMADHLDSEVLFELAWLKKYNSTAMVVRRSLTDEGVEKLVDILVDRQSVPTIGFFRKYGRKHAA